MNRDPKLQHLAKLVVRVERQSFRSAQRIVWFFRCRSDGCTTVLHENVAKRRDGFCFPCIRETKQVLGFYSPTAAKFADRVVAVTRAKNKRLKFTCLCVTPGCTNRPTTHVPKKIATLRCRRCYLRAKAKKLPFETAYARFLRDAKNRDKSVDLTLADYQKFASCLTCFYCHRELNRTGFAYRGTLKLTLGHCMDRINQELGYTRDNIIPCCGRCNLMRGPHLTALETVLIARHRTYGAKETGNWLDRGSAKLRTAVAAWHDILWRGDVSSVKLPKGMAMEWNLASWYLR